MRLFVKPKCYWLTEKAIPAAEMSVREGSWSLDPPMGH